MPPEMIAIQVEIFLNNTDVRHNYTLHLIGNMEKRYRNSITPYQIAVKESPSVSYMVPVITGESSIPSRENNLVHTYIAIYTSTNTRRLYVGIIQRLTEVHLINSY